MKYKVGQFVRIISKFNTRAEYYVGNPGISLSMYDMCGKCYKIKSIIDCDYGEGFVYKIADENGIVWCYTDEMIEEQVVPVGDGIFVSYSDNVMEV